MFRFLKTIFGHKSKPNKFAISAAVKARAILNNKAITHKRAGDYCNGCQKHVSECPVFKGRI